MIDPLHPPVLEFVGVSYHDPLHRTPLLEHLEFSLSSGESLALTGPAGSGKSTALGLILGACRVTRGEVLVCDQNPAVLGRLDLERLRTRVGYLAQHGALLSNLTLYDNLVLPLRYHRRATDQEARPFLEAACQVLDLELADVPRLLPALVSPELRRLVALARALILEPALLVVDEPAVGLGGNAARELWRLLGLVRERRSLAIIVATIDAIAGRDFAGRTIALPPRPHATSRLMRTFGGGEHARMASGAQRP
jgi:phospholipid/cholesterol/gamma-HCH transport system ATP-binding protein